MHARDTAAVAAAFSVDPQRGLAAGEAVRRSVHFGRNVLHAAARSPFPRHAVARVLCDGRETAVPAADLVPGDVIVIEPGMDVPADARVLTASGLTIDESELTGARVPVAKSAETVDESTPLTQRRSMLYLGTHAVSGCATAIVTATGDATEIAKIRHAT